MLYEQLCKKREFLIDVVTPNVAEQDVDVAVPQEKHVGFLWLG